MKSLFLTALFTMSIISASWADNYHLNESKLDQAFESSVDVSNDLSVTSFFESSSVESNAMLADGTPQGSTPRDESKMMTADRVAEKLLKGISHRYRQMILTSVGKIAILLNRIFPRWLDYIVVRFINKEQ